MEPNESLPPMTLLQIMEWLNSSVVYPWIEPGHFFIQACFQNSSGEKQSNVLSLSEQQNSNSPTPEWHICDAFQQERKFDSIEGMGNGGVGP
jgi:hypothetical protein